MLTLTRIKKGNKIGNKKKNKNNNKNENENEKKEKEGDKERGKGKRNIFLILLFAKGETNFSRM